MSAFSGPQYKGAMRDHRDTRKREAIKRNAQTLPERRSKKRQAKS